MDDIKQHIADVEEMYQKQLILSEEIKDIIRTLTRLTEDLTTDQA